MIYYNWFGCISRTLFMIPAVLVARRGFFCLLKAMHVAERRAVRLIYTGR